MTGRAEDGHAVAGIADGWLPTAGQNGVTSAETHRRAPRVGASP